MTRTLKSPSWRWLKRAVAPMNYPRNTGRRPDSIRNWVKKYAPVEVNGKSISADELKKLRKDNAILKEELEILKRAAVLLAKH